ncbi:conserved hypothetical protein [Methylomarinovum tepidoasis]|uniref:Aminoglycoside phosphotransferase domain-containing protein n=1 Tax=Methylomarinovum tepidoasis TaxID=2840183 RepID=A0AAU9CXI1_9GAMM|nr:bifunctional aminoglycoside phosphotransferase/ATP-binding protein [Methylomarinovum sp. IN45]BCX88844.1 conserved hypothetical protein [Methylomarinovum sp. IN45]
MTLPPLIRALLNPAVYPHPTENLRYRETHISWVILTGPYAYKLKKPVDFGFLDFSTLEKRRFYCHEELRLNRRLAPQLYLAVVTVTGTPQAPRLDGDGEPLEYAVKMRQFADRDLLSRMAEEGRLRESHLETLAARIARFHESVARASAGDPYGEPQTIQSAALQNFQSIDARALDPARATRLDALRRWTEAAFERLASCMARRKRDGWVRECHGDLHLGNIVLWQGEPLPFDCIEFNPQLRWIDVISEIAFTVMDLAARGRRPLGFLFLNDWLSLTGDYDGVRLLRYYLIYRAMVRAKIAWLSARQHPKDRRSLDECARYLDLAEDFRQSRRPLLLVTHGFSGSGKSYASRRLATRLGAIHLRSDVERKRLAGLPAGARTDAGLERGIYEADFTRRTYAKLLRDAETILAAGWPVIVDATFLRREYRRWFQALAERLHVPWRLLDFQADETVLRARIEQRLRQRRDPSEADLQVLAYQQQHHQPLNAEERARAVPIDTNRGFDVEAVLQYLNSRGSS